MIYHWTAYFGAVKNGKAPFFVTYEAFDCHKPMDGKSLDEGKIVEYLQEEIRKHKLDPSIFEYRWLTHDEYLASVQETKRTSSKKVYPSKKGE